MQPPHDGGEALRASLKKPAKAVVRCKDFQCLAYRDANGKWRSVADDQELEVLEVVTEF